jgi:hypothetical protein
MSTLGRTLALLLVAAAVAVALVLWSLWPEDRTAAPTIAEPDATEPRAGSRRRRHPASARHSRAADPAGSATPTNSPQARDESSPSPSAVAVPDSAADGEDCEDGDPCTGHDRVVGGICVGEPFVCEDDSPLTVDYCVHDGCVHDFRPREAAAGEPLPANRP